MKTDKRRLIEAEEEYKALLQKLQSLDKKISALRVLVHLEEDGVDEDIASSNRARIIFTPSVSPGDFILRVMKDGRPWPLTELRDAALDKGLLKDSSSPGRSIMGALMGLKKQGLVDKRGEDWILTKKALQ